MNGCKKEMENLLGFALNNSRENGENEFYFSFADNDFEKGMKKIAEKGLTCINLFCVENFAGKDGFTLFYVFEQKGNTRFSVVELKLAQNKALSLATLFPTTGWYEREIHDGFGILFVGTVDERRLFLHEFYPSDFHPLLKSTKNQIPKLKKSVLPEEEYRFKPVHGEGIYQIPVGPVHAGIIEPGHFRFSVIGETIFNLEIRMFFKHRGIEKLAEGKQPTEVVKIAEAISGDESVANAVGYSQAIEQLSQVTPPLRGLQLRMLFLELERLYSLLGDLAGMIIDVAYPVGASPFFMLREDIFRINQQLTGSRFLKEVIVIGGVRKNIDDSLLATLPKGLKLFSRQFLEAVQDVYSSAGVIDRLDTTGIVKTELVRPLNFTGPIARAAGVAIDTRVNHPYCRYDVYVPSIQIREKGDVFSRFKVKAHEIQQSVGLLHRLIKEMPKGEVVLPVKIKDGYALSVVESARGQNVHWVYVKDGKIDRYKVRTASFCNWQAVEHAVLGNIVPDFPLVNKSMNLSYAGTDL